MSWSSQINNKVNMKRNNVLGIGLLFLAFIIPSGNIFGQESEKPNAIKEYVASLDKPITLRGDYFKAILAAYELDFSIYISRNKQEIANRKKDNKDYELFEFLSDLRNYDIFVEMKGSDYEVNFAPTLRNNAPDIFGGGASYKIDSHTFLIKEKLYTK